ncbi:Metallo-dependent phosphatase-like protein [Sporodiniella umbellata]|nr:Metallo-dependent phosphatase-like protein [Sporodiniella umbellata]
MGVLSSIGCLSFCVLLIQTTLISAVPYQGNRALLKRGKELHGRFLHITDIHLDNHYLEGSDPATICHRRGKSHSSEVGKFGALGTECDTPISLVKATFDFLKEHVQDIDFILYTGDTARHDRDKSEPITSEDILTGHKTILKQFESAYDTSYTPMIPTIGNNDGLNHNDITKQDKVFTQLQTIWKPLELNLTHTFGEGGYFTQELIKNRLSVINTNSMYFFKKDDDASDCDQKDSPGRDQLRWLEAALKHYEHKSHAHQVYLMGHVPPVDDDGSRLFKKACYTQYVHLLGQYSHLIAGHFTGHTNNDNLNAIVKDGADYRLVHAGKHSTVKAPSALGLFNAPSVLPKHNPALRVYEYDTEGEDYPVGTILDWQQYYLDLEKANEEREANYELEYTASDLFGIDHFDGEGVAKVLNTIAEDKKIRKLYKKYAKVSS